VTGSDQISEVGEIRYHCNSEFSRVINISKRSVYCLTGIPHAYPSTYVTDYDIPIKGSKFQDLMYFKPNPWQPNPMIFSLSTGVGSARKVLNNWGSLAEAAKRNVPS
jgi:hypothetical protein